MLGAFRLPSGTVPSEWVVGAAMTDSAVSVVFLGTGAAAPSPIYYCKNWPACTICGSSDVRDDRVETGVMVESGGHRLLLDAGRGVARRFVELAWHKRLGAEINNGERPEDMPPLDVMALSHSHFDHWGSFEEFSKMHWRGHQGKPTEKEGRPFRIYAHRRTRAKLEAAGGALGKYAMPPTVEFVDCEAGTPYGVAENLQLVGYEVEHSNVDGCLAFLLTIEDASDRRTVFMVGDTDPLTDAEGHTESWAEEIRARAQRVDLLIVSAKSGWHDRRHGQMSVCDILGFFREAAPRRLVLLHFSHGLNMNHEEMLGALRETQAEMNWPSTIEVIIAYDGLSLSL